MGLLVQLAGAVVALISTAVFVRIGIRQYRMWKAATEPMDNAQCIACQSHAVIESAPECFCCRACGFTWGSGLQAMRTKLLRAELERMPPDKREERALVELQEADAKLLSAEALLVTASQQLGGDLVGDLMLGGSYGPLTKDPYSETRSESLVKAVGEMRLAQLHAIDAEAALGAPISLPTGAVEPSDALLLADMFLESMLLDLLAHHRANDLLAHARKMRRAVRAALNAVGSARA